MRESCTMEVLKWKMIDNNNNNDNDVNNNGDSSNKNSNVKKLECGINIRGRNTGWGKNK